MDAPAIQDQVFKDRVRKFVELLEEETEAIRLMLNRSERRLRIDINQIERRDRESYDGFVPRLSLRSLHRGQTADSLRPSTDSSMIRAIFYLLWNKQ